MGFDQVLGAFSATAFSSESRPVTSLSSLSRKLERASGVRLAEGLALESNVDGPVGGEEILLVQHHDNPNQHFFGDNLVLSLRSSITFRQLSSKIVVFVVSFPAADAGSCRAPQPFKMLFTITNFKAPHDGRGALQSAMIRCREVDVETTVSSSLPETSINGRTKTRL